MTRQSLISSPTIVFLIVHMPSRNSVLCAVQVHVGELTYSSKRPDQRPLGHNCAEPLLGITWRYLATNTFWRSTNKNHARPTRTATTVAQSAGPRSPVSDVVVLQVTFKTAILPFHDSSPFNNCHVWIL